MVCLASENSANSPTPAGILGRDVFRFFPRRKSPGHVAVHPLKIAFVQGCELDRVALGGLDLLALLVFKDSDFQCFLRALRSYLLNDAGKVEGYGEGQKYCFQWVPASGHMGRTFLLTN